MTKTRKARLSFGKRAVFCAGVLALGGLAGVGLWLCGGFAAEESLSTFAMGSYVQQTVWGGQDSARAANEAIVRLENEISWRVRDSGIARLNASAGKAAVSLGEEAASVMKEALALCQESGGALDITLGAVTQLWSFDENPRLPQADQLEAALALTGWRGLSLQGDQARLARPGMAVDLGGIGKGAACDAAVESYQTSGVKRAVAAVGGSIGLYGRKPFGQPWRVAVRNPLGEGSLGTLELEGGFVSTSGSYEKRFEAQGRSYHHLLDPRTGYPAESGLISVTVWHPESGLASDGLATACFVLGLGEGLELLRKSGGEGVFVDEESNVYLTDGLAGRFTLHAGEFHLAELP